MRLIILGRFFIPIISIILARSTYANDGSFRVNGNELIPISESVVSVKKEILTIKRINNNQAEVNVYYEFYNPKEYKVIEVGFEAYSPMGDVSTAPVDGKHPYIHQFSVIMNEKQLPFQVAIVGSKQYFRDGKFVLKKKSAITKEVDEGDYVNFFYVYHFRAPFNNGLNIIKHTYVVDLSTSVIENYALKYILTAAKRWANHQIDDFTLNIDMGQFQDISIENTFFKNASEWTIGMNGKSIQHSKDTSEFFIRNCTISLHKMNFKPAGELEIHSFSAYYYRNTDTESDYFDCNSNDLPFSIKDQDQISKPANDLSKRVLRNLPFARRGYVFKSAEIQIFYKKQKWYLPDSTYVPQANLLTIEEQKWLKKLEQ